MSERDWVRVTKDCVDFDRIFCHGTSFDDVILKLYKLKEQYVKYESQGCQIFFDVEYYGYDGGSDVYVIVDRPETDKEYEKRLSKEAEEARIKALRKAERDARKIAKAQAMLAESEEAERAERAEYERLKAKFG